jgi:TRAP-type C4-dicarboxylate transport system substrate-binding protein
MITSPSTGANSKAWDFVSHYSPINAWVPKNIVVVNARAFRRLPGDVQKAVLDAAATAEARGWEMSKAEADAKTAILKENGMTIYDPSAELQAGLEKIGAKMLENWRANASEAALAVLDAYRN